MQSVVTKQTRVESGSETRVESRKIPTQWTVPCRRTNCFGSSWFVNNQTEKSSKKSQTTQKIVAWRCGPMIEQNCKWFWSFEYLYLGARVEDWSTAIFSQAITVARLKIFSSVYLTIVRTWQCILNFLRMQRFFLQFQYCLSQNWNFKRKR